MKKKLVTAAALITLAATALGAVQVTAPEAMVCIPPAVIQALS
jgi:hypothetical protein